MKVVPLGKFGKTNMKFDLSFYKDKTVLITGHTGFKGSWLSEILILAGAKVVGYSLEPNTNPNLFSILGLEKKMASHIGDIRDLKKLNEVFDRYQPQIVIHLAAQPIVRDSYKNPVYTYETNVIGTVNVCECVRLHSCVKSFLNVTTDKVYENNDVPDHPFREEEKLDGYDPYSNSKSCSELVTHSYIKSFLHSLGIPTSTARAGNVIGGGDFSNDRIIPDCYRALATKKPLIIRNPNSTRPYQHVFEPLICYLLIAQKQFEDSSFSGAYNVGPNPDSFVNTELLVKKFKMFTTGFEYKIESDGGPHEAAFLSLDNSKLKKVFKWSPIMDIEHAVKITATWYQSYIEKANMVEISDNQIKEYFSI